MADFTEIYDLYADKVYHYLLGLSRDRHRAEELTQETFLKALQNIEQYEGRSSIYYGPLLYGCDTSLAGRHNVTELPSLSHAELSAARPEPGRQGRFLVKLSDGITLCDFRMLGYSGAQYVTFFKVV